LLILEYKGGVERFEKKQSEKREAVYGNQRKAHSGERNSEEVQQ